MLTIKKIYTLVVNNRCCTENHILVTDTTRTFIGYYDQISDWLDEFFIGDYMSLSEDCPENGYIRTDIVLHIQYVNAYGDVVFRKESKQSLKNEWEVFNTDSSIINFVKRWIFDITYATDRGYNKILKGRKYDHHMIEEISQD